VNVLEAVETAVSPTVAFAAAVPEVVRVQVRDVAVVFAAPLAEEVTRFELYEALKAAARAVLELSAVEGDVFTVQAQENGDAEATVVPLYATVAQESDTAYALYCVPPLD
jgi:hypothetical protein